MIKLRDYQVKAKNELYKAIKEGEKRILWCLPTGAGKSTLGASVCKDIVSKNKRVLFFVHSKELVNQFSKRLSDQFGLHSGIIMSGVDPNYQIPIQVASVQTLVRRDPPKADVVFIDESHRAKANSYQKIIESYPDAIIIGLTATPYRMDGKPLGEIFTKLVHPIKINMLIGLGHLVGTKCYGPTKDVDLVGIKITAGDYDRKQLSDRFSDNAVTRGVVDNYLKNAKGKKAICFNINVDHSKEMNEMFIRNGITSAHIDGTTPKAERDQIVKDFANGKYNILNNIGVFTEGFDVPDTECVILNRATKSEGLYVQMAGRGLRPAEGKDKCIILDHGSNVARFGFVEDYDVFEFDLNKKRKKSKKQIEAKKCKQCNSIRKKDVKVCQCGFVFPVIERSLKFSDPQDFVLIEREKILVDELKKISNSNLSLLPDSHLRLFAAIKGYKAGWYFHQGIERGIVEGLEVGSPAAYSKMNFKLSLLEKENNLQSLYLKLKNASKARKVG